MDGWMDEWMNEWMNERQNFNLSFQRTASVGQNNLLVLTDASPLTNFHNLISFCLILIYFTGTYIAGVHKFYENWGVP
jgi:hypothetical protein